MHGYLHNVISLVKGLARILRNAGQGLNSSWGDDAQPTQPCILPLRLVDKGVRRETYGR